MKAPIQVVGLLLLYAVALAVSNPWMTFVDDETWVIHEALLPAHTTLDRFFSSGVGQHEHPPLFDLIQHGWLVLTRSDFRLLRLPSMLFFLAGLWVLSRAAAKLGGEAAGHAALILGVLWPYGFHFGRLVGWYSLAFLLTAVLLWCYLRFREQPGWRRWAPLVATATLLIYTNYWGWAVVACLLVHSCVAGHMQRLLFFRWALWTALALALLFLPLIPALAARLGRGLGLAFSPLASASYAAFNVYALFVSESVAPWFWLLSVPACVAIVACLMAAAAASSDSRWLLLSFFSLLGAMALLGILSTKRLLLLAPLLLLPLALAVRHPRLLGRRVVVVSLSVLAVIGWSGILSRRFYAAPRFLEPWQEVTVSIADKVEQGTLVVGNNPSFFFYLTYALHAKQGRQVKALFPYQAKHPLVFDSVQWANARQPARGSVVLVKGIMDAGIQRATRNAEQWLDNRCPPPVVSRFLPDTGYGWKKRLFSIQGQAPWRIEIREYACGDRPALSSPSPGSPVAQ